MAEPNGRRYSRPRGVLGDLMVGGNDIKAVRGLACASAAAVLACAVALPAAAPRAAAAAAPQAKAAKKLTKRERAQRLRKKNARQKRPNVIVIMTDDQNESMEGLPYTQALLG